MKQIHFTLIIIIASISYLDIVKILTGLLSAIQALILVGVFVKWIINKCNGNISNNNEIYVKSETPTNALEKCKQQSERIKEISDLLFYSDTYKYHGLSNRLDSFRFRFWQKRFSSTSDLYDYILDSANNRIITAKREFVIRECRQVIQIVTLLKKQASNEKIFRAIGAKITTTQNTQNKPTKEQLENVFYNYINNNDSIKKGEEYDSQLPHNKIIQTERESNKEMDLPQCELSNSDKLLTDQDGFAVVEKKSDAEEFAIEEKPLPTQPSTTSVIIDSSELHILEQQTRAAQELLSAIFAEDKTEERPNICTTNANNSIEEKQLPLQYSQELKTPDEIINYGKLRILEQQTKAAQELLSAIFVEDEADELQKTSANNANNTWLEILQLLLTKEIWNREEFKSICKKRGFMPGAILEQINDFAYEKVNDVVIEDDGNSIYVTLDYKDQLI